MNTIALLNDFRRDQSLEAFATLTHRYVNLVFSVAWRRLNDQPLAELATKTVFARLAGAPPTVTTESELLGWIHQTALHVALDLRQSESCRKTSVPTEEIGGESTTEQDATWNKLAPRLDEAIENLSPTERQALLMKFFQDNSHYNVGPKLAIRDDTAKIHVSRALERLRVSFSAEGITCTASGLTKLLTDHAILTPPAELVARLTSLPQVPASSLDGTREAAAAGWLSKITSLFRRKGVGQ